jgi:hypothetical protein
MVHLLSERKLENNLHRKAHVARTNRRLVLGVELMVPVNLRWFNHSRKIRIDAALFQMDASDDPQARG